MTAYVRSEYHIEVLRRGDEAIFRTTDPHGTAVENSVAAAILDQAARGDDGELTRALASSAVVAALQATHIGSGFDLTRAAVTVRERGWAAIAWESFAPPNACVVRTCEVRPRVLQIPFSFPIRILEASNTPPIVAASLDSIFFESRRDMAMISGHTGLDTIGDFPGLQRWPTVDILHLRDPEIVGASTASLLQWLQPFAEHYQVRLVILECGAAVQREARCLAQTLVERAGPAIWVTPSTQSEWRQFYAAIAHDRPLDWTRTEISNGELFGGARREDLLRYSGLGTSLSQKRVIDELTTEILERAAPAFEATFPTRAMRHIPNDIRLTTKAISSAARSLRIPWRVQASHLDFRWVAPGKRARFGAAVSTYLAQHGVYAPQVDTALATHSRGDESVDVRELTRTIGRGAKPLHELTLQNTATIYRKTLRSIAKLQPELRYEDHESDGMLPLAAKVTEARTLMRALTGRASRRAEGSQHVNAAFFGERTGGTLRRLPQKTTRFRPGEIIHLGIQIGEKDAFIVTLGSSALLEELTRAPEGTALELGVSGIDFELLGDPVQHLVLAKDGTTDLVTFALRPRKDTTAAGVARLRLSVFHKNNLVQSFLMAAVLEGATDVAHNLSAALSVPVSEVRAAGKVGYLMRLEYSAAPIGQAGSGVPRALSIVANESAGQKVITIKGQELFHVSTDPNIPDSVSKIREALDRASATDKKYRYIFQMRPNEGNPAELFDTLWDVGRAGWRLYSLLVPRSNDQDLIRKRLEAGGAIHAAHIDASSVIPWSLVYDRKLYDRTTYSDPSNPAAPVLDVEKALCPVGMPDSQGTMSLQPCGTEAGCLLHPSENERRQLNHRPIVCADTVVCPRRFWGFIVPIEVPAQQVEGVDGQPPPSIKTQIQATNPVEVVAGFNPNLSFYPDHEIALAKIVADRQAQFKKPARPGRDALCDLLETSQPDIVYLFCHAIAALVGRGGQGVGPSLDFGLGYKGKVEDVLEAEDFAGKAWKHGPLVFMNGCGTAGFSPYAPSAFIKRFIQGRDAAAVIGTEVTVWQVLATEFATEFLREFLGQKRAGEALLKARGKLLAKSNPLGLIYTLYGSAELKITTGT
jgi:hypothetical protein